MHCVQAYVRLLEQDVAKAADVQTSLQEQLANAPGEAAAPQQQQERLAAAEARRAAALQELQLERHRCTICKAFAAVVLWVQGGAMGAWDAAQVMQVCRVEPPVGATK
jgi:hypothetical protein